MIKSLRLFALLFLVGGATLSWADPPLILQHPTLSQTRIVFSYAGDLWSVGREGGQAVRLTSSPGSEGAPCFSPDGKTIAFTGEYDGSVDVFTVPIEGGEPKRLTYHPASDIVVGWSRDGKQVIFRSNRDRMVRLYSVPAEGGFPVETPLPMASEGSYSPDGTHLAYVPWGAQGSWKKYRGGMARPIWIADLKDSSIQKLPRKDSNDSNPIWLGDKIYFLSDRDGSVTLYEYDTKSDKVERVLNNDGYDLRYVSACDDTLVYQQFGDIYLMDLKDRKPKRVEIRITGDLPEVRPHFERVGNRISSAAISPTGVRAVFEARGEILSVPAEKGDFRNLTNTLNANDRDPAWSPDGKTIAYLGDESGEYALYLKPQTGGDARRLSLGNPPSFFYRPTWSPDSKSIALIDKRGKFWVVDASTGRMTLADTEKRVSNGGMSYSWSPDSRWLTYTKTLDNGMGAVFLYSLDTKKVTQVTDGMSDAQSPAFDRSGKYLFFGASTDVGPATDWDMSSFDRTRSYSIYVAVLRKDLPSPLAPESDEEKVTEPAKEPEKKPEPAKEPEKKPEPAKDAKPEEKAKDAKPEEKKAEDKKAEEKKAADGKRTRIDLDRIGQRILALPIPARNYVGLTTAKDGIVLIFEAAQPGPGGFSGMAVHKYDLNKRKLDRLADGIGAFVVSANGEKVLFSQGGRWGITGVEGFNPGSGTLNVGQMEVRVDPRAEWRQMYDEVWRIERDYFYDPNLHGVDREATAAKYRPYLDGVASRADLNALFQEMLGNLCVGHMYISGGDSPSVARLRGGLLGADYTIENGRYRFSRIFNGENWNPNLRAPLTEPGVDVKEGDYLLAVEGQDVKPPANLYSFFEETAGRAITIKVGPNADGKDSREVKVVPIDSEGNLRQLAWIEGNRRMVDKLSNGLLAYVYIPNTSGEGYTYFNRYFYPGVGRKGAVVDERFNGGGQGSDYVIDHLRRTFMGRWAVREGEDWITPGGGIFGPKVMLCNEFAGSGGDYLPWMFRRAKLGKLIGKRTWGGLVGIGSAPGLMDGGSVTAPFFRFYTPDSEWDIENKGVTPDIEVEFDPKAWREGRDPQIEKGVEVALEELKQNPPPDPKRPAYPNFWAKQATK
ncbi:MAG TPA: PDZ domain-containing protein [Armatimonadota bacterium]|jgi:tricorn protease